LVCIPLAIRADLIPINNFKEWFLKICSLADDNTKMTITMLYWAIMVREKPENISRKKVGAIPESI